MDCNFEVQEIDLFPDLARGGGLNAKRPGPIVAISQCVTPCAAICGACECGGGGGKITPAEDGKSAA